MKRIICLLTLCLFFSIGSQCLAQDQPQAAAGQSAGEQIPLFPGATYGKLTTFEATKTTVASDIRYVTGDGTVVTIDTLMLKGIEDNYQGTPGFNRVELAVIDNMRTDRFSVANIRFEDFQFDSQVAAGFSSSMNAGEFAAILKSFKAGLVSITDFTTPEITLKSLRLTGITFDTSILDAYKDKTMPTSVMGMCCATAAGLEFTGFSSTSKEGLTFDSFKMENISMLGTGKGEFKNVTFVNNSGKTVKLDTFTWDRLSLPFLSKVPMTATGQLSEEDLFVFGEDKLAVSGLRLVNMHMDMNPGISTIDEITTDLNLDVGDAISFAFALTGFQFDEAARTSSGMPAHVAALLKGPMTVDIKISMPDIVIQPLESGGKNIAINNASTSFKTREITEISFDGSMGVALTQSGGFAGFNLNDGAKLSIIAGKLVDLVAVATGKQPQSLRAEAVAGITATTAQFSPQDQQSIQAVKDFVEKDGKLSLLLSVNEKDGRPSYIDHNDLMHLAKFSQGLTVDMVNREASLTLTHEPTPGWQ